MRILLLAALVMFLTIPAVSAQEPEAVQRIRDALPDLTNPPKVPPTDTCPFIFNNGFVGSPQNWFIIDPYGCYWRILDRVISPTAQAVMRLLPL